VRYIKFPRGFRELITVGTDGLIYEDYSLDLVQARWSECYHTANIEVVCCGVEVYLHAFSVTSLDGDVPSISNSDGQFPAQRTTGTVWIGGTAGQPETTDWAKESSVAKVWEPIEFLTDRRLVNV
jgi:hypothetical protein